LKKEMETGQGPLGALVQTAAASTSSSVASSITKTPTLQNSLDGVRNNLQEKMDTPPQADEESTAKSSSKEKKKRRSSKDVQKDAAEDCKRRKVESVGMKLATERIHANKQLSPSNPKKKSQAKIVQEVNQVIGSNINAKTASRMANQGLIEVLPLKKGPPRKFAVMSGDP
jgi:hypothetical protein